MTHKSRPGLVTPLLAVSATLGLVFLGASIFGFIRREIGQSSTDFRQRHLEATQAIERVYAHYRDHGSWPSKVDVERVGQQWLPPEWEYENDSELGGPIVWLHGPYHMMLFYRFAPPQQGAVSDTWTLSIEGDKSTFAADVGYQLHPPADPRCP